MAARPSASFKAELDSFKKESTSTLTPADLAHLKRWAEDDRADEVWNKISRKAWKRGIPLYASFFIREVLGARSISESVEHLSTQRRFYQERATQMENLANFLRHLRPSIILLPLAMKLPQMLEDTAKILREQVSPNSRGPMRVSRVDRNGSRRRKAFIRVMSSDWPGICSDYELSVLTEIAFDIRDVTVDQVKWAQRRTTRSGPSKHRKSRKPVIRRARKGK